MENLEPGFISNTLLHLVSTYGVFGVYLGTFFLGENIILIALLLSLQGYLDVWTVVIYSFLGSLSADLFWYFFGNAFFTHQKILTFIEERKKSSKMINFLLKQNLLITFTLIKFLVGIRLILTLGFILIKKISFVRYFFLCILSNSLFVLALYGFASLVKKGINVLNLYHSFNTILISGIALIFIINITPPLINYFFSKK